MATETHYFKSEEVKKNFEKQVNEICDTNPTNFLDILNSQTQVLSKTYLNNTKVHTYTFDFSLDSEQKIKVNIKTETNNTELNKQKLRNAIREKGIRRNNKKVVAKQNNIDNSLGVTKEMHVSYKKACEKFYIIQAIYKNVDTVPTPAAILSDVEKYAKDTKNKMVGIYLIKELDQEGKTALLNHPYFKYMTAMTGVTQEHIMQSLMQLMQLYNQKKQEEKQVEGQVEGQIEGQIEGQVEGIIEEHKHDGNCNHNHDLEENTK